MSAILSRSGIPALPGSDTSWLMYVLTVLHSEMAAVPRAQACLFPTLTNKDQPSVSVLSEELCLITQAPM